MNSKTKYKTKQRDLLLDYLKSQSGKHVTASDIYNHLSDQGKSISQATIYRQLEKLVDEGVINKYVIDAGSPSCFEYNGHENHEDAEICFHCKCEKCGKLIHLHCEELENIQTHLSEEHNFSLDPIRTVFYGRCDECRQD